MIGINMKYVKVGLFGVLFSSLLAENVLTSEPLFDVSKSIEEEISTTNLYRAYYPSKELSRKARITFHNEIHEMNSKEGYLVLELNAQDKDKLLSFGFTIYPATQFIDKRNQRLEGLQQKFSAQASDSISIQSIPSYPCYETVEETFSTADSIASSYSNLAEFIDVGNSWEKSQGLGGFDIKVLKLTNKSTGGFKPKLFINSAIHAREYATAPLVLAFANWLVEGYGTDADATWILDYNEVHLMLHTNPDGRKRAESGLSWRKNTNQNYCGSTSNTRGVDLNRNFTAGWNSTNGQGSSGSECSLTFRGDSPGSEPETQAIEGYVRSLFPDSRGPNRNDAAPEDTSGIHIDVHSFSELVLWPWGDTSTQAPNGPALQTLGRRFAFFNGYEPTQSIGLYPTDGTSDSVSYDELGVAAYTFELGTAFFQSCNVFENSIKPDNLPALIYAAKVVRAPYLIPAGPDVTQFNVSGGSGVPAGTQVTLSGSVSDTQFNNSNGTESTQNISAVEYSIDTPPWVAGVNTFSLSASDGAFNEKTEAYNGVLDTTGIGEGTHIIYVRSRDAGGNWGPVTAEFLTIGDFEPPTPIECSDGALDLNNSGDYGTTNPGSSVVTADGCSITLSGNVWRISDQTYDISENTTVTFDFSASGTAEIQGIGFDQDNTLSADQVFQLAGTQDWGIRDFNYTGNGVVQTITIPVGQYYSGSNFSLTIANDKDSGAQDNSVTLSNVIISDDEVPPLPPEDECIELENVSAFTNSNTGTFTSQGCTISLLGNIWRASDDTFTITPESVLTFDFSSNQEGEIHGIGFDEDNTASTNRIFQLSGSQNWGIQDFDYSGGTQTYSIAVGQYYTGTGMKLILVNDQDSGSQTNTTIISNVKLTN